MKYRKKYIIEKIMKFKVKNYLLRKIRIFSNIN